jgi:hypothetical protein
MPPASNALERVERSRFFCQHRRYADSVSIFIALSLFRIKIAFWILTGKDRDEFV